MTAMDIEDALFQFKRTALAFSLILLPGTVLHWTASYPLFDAISTIIGWQQFEPDVERIRGAGAGPSRLAHLRTIKSEQPLESA